MLTSAIPSIAAEDLERFSLDTGYQSTITQPLVVTRDGRILWITGAPDSSAKGTFQVTWNEVRESRDSGRTWGPPRILFRGTPEVAIGASEMVRLASGKLLLIGSRFGGYSEDGDPAKSLLVGFSQISTDDGATWSEPRPLPTGERYFNGGMSPIIQLSGGRIIFPFGYLTKEGMGRFNVSVLYSDDEGETWHRSQSNLSAGGYGNESGADEPCVVELPDGRVWMLIRYQAGFLYESFSSDQGVTWKAPTPSRFPSSGAPAALLRLRSGRIVVAWNNSVRRAYARHCLVMAASDDGCRTFYGFREIAHTDYPVTSLDTYWGAMYPKLAEAPDGRILVAYNYGDWNFNQAKLVRVDPAWLKEGSLMEDFRNGRGAWCHLGANGDQLTAPEDNEPGASLQIDYQKRGPSGIVRNFPLVSQGEMRLTITVLKPQAYLLWHDSFLDPGKTDEACLRVRFADNGQVFVGAGTPRTKDLGQGNEHRPTYSYLAYPVETEQAYPGKVKLGERFTVKVRCDVAKGEALLSINDGVEVNVPLGNILGLSYFGIAATEGGSIRLRRFESFQR
jgi:hypothetical protein